MITEVFSNYRRFDEDFAEFLRARDEKLHDFMQKSRMQKTKMPASVLLDLGLILEEFLIPIFNLSKWQEENVKKAIQEREIWAICRNFIQRFLLVKYDGNWYKNVDRSLEIFQNLDKIWNFDDIDGDVVLWLKNYGYSLNYDEVTDDEFDEKCRQIAFIFHANLVKNSSLLQNPKENRHFNLVPNEKSERNDFRYVGENLEKVASYGGNYCLYCHERGKDSCKNGLFCKDGKIAKNNDGIELSGCPLEQDISPAIAAFRDGKFIASLAIMMVENPLICLTGNRICNDCMKSCIYQKQDPVDIPAIETVVFERVLRENFGFELYFLLTRCNVLNAISYIPKSLTGSTIFISGMGPAGIASAFFNAMEGNYVILSDGGLFLAPDIDITLPIEHFQLDKLPQNRNSSCFGGVMEYGITSRWNKNFIDIAYVILARFRHIAFFSNIKYSLLLEKLLYEMDFAKIFVANGAKNPRNIKNPEISSFFVSASEFLMNLHLGKSFDEKSKHEVKILMPAVVLGGGLTAIDAATEAGFYYLSKIENVYKKFTKMSEKNSINSEEFSRLELANLERYIGDYRKTENIANSADKIEKLGGVKVLIRKGIFASAAYQQNHVEIAKARAQGVIFCDETEILGYEKSEDGVKILTNKGEIFARSIIVAYGSERADIADNVDSAKCAKYGSKISITGGVFDDKKKDMNSLCVSDFDKKTAYLGDMTEKFSGSVVKAIASGKKSVFYGDYQCERACDVRVQNADYQSCKINEKFHVLCSFFAQETCVQEVEFGVFKIKYKSAMLTKIAKIGDLTRMKIVSNGVQSESIPMIISGFSDGFFTSVVKVVGNSTKMLLDKDAKFFVMHSSRSDVLQSILSKDLHIFYDDLRDAVAMELCRSLGCRISHVDNFECSGGKVLFLASCDIVDIFAQKFDLKGGNYYSIVFKEMQCMLSGVCSKCRYLDGTGGWKFACRDYCIVL
ncbi:hypothetical protein [Candidatus Deianiraea vastatrix]|uniref:Bifunctional glutamate synthase subunit beta/2-polyprenylphenol hydroxylase n=1 Tax=Candidatus Deianiraea vastatrix TaxID=2163644 RepID=A0A5B8XEZ9_9RICK|nr:hypothetical protein [Candidatus Deianiraea vastatrix]QED23830.1 Putative bifunctional glutamate synthase subunit beta/2-polyprenylphenol hydroxylase [Candidatus Deianiraea vastatrix]